MKTHSEIEDRLLEENAQEDMWTVLFTLLYQTLPNLLCILCYYLSTVVGLFFIDTQKIDVLQLHLGVLFLNIFGLFIIFEVNLGLINQIPKALKFQKYILVGYHYQRALWINIVISIFIISPILFITKYFFQKQYLFQLVPTIYAVAFFDTTRIFLQAQNFKMVPLVIQILGLVIAILLSWYFIVGLQLGMIGSAWACNFSFFFDSIAIYLYIVIAKPVEKSWIEWTQKAFQKWSYHIKYVQFVGINDLIQSLAFLAMALIASSMPNQDAVVYLILANTFLLIYYVEIGIKQGFLRYLVKQILAGNNRRIRNLIKYRNIVTLVFSLIFSVIFLIKHDQIFKSFGVKVDWLVLIMFIMCIFVTSLNLIFLTINSALDRSHHMIIVNLVCYLLGVILAYLVRVGWCIWLNWGCWQVLIISNFFSLGKINWTGQQDRIQSRVSKHLT